LVVTEGEEGEFLVRPAQREPDDVSPERDRLLDIGDAEDDRAQPDTAKLHQGQLRSSHHKAAMA
jgi:hypothetical protein